jgi:hypothetical protein
LDEIADMVADFLSPINKSGMSSTEAIPSLERLEEIEREFSVPCASQGVALVRDLEVKSRGGVHRRKRGSLSRNRGTSKPRKRASRRV